MLKCHALRDLVPFVQFKKREKDPWRIGSFRKIVGFSKWYWYKLCKMVPNHAKCLKFFS